MHGLVEEGCNNYRAVNGKCDPYHRCGTCWPESCDPVQNYTKYYVKDYGKVSGRLNMMSEIHNRGPIACSIGYDFLVYRLNNALSDAQTNLTTIIQVAFLMSFLICPATILYRFLGGDTMKTPKQSTGLFETHGVILFLKNFK